MKKILFLLFLSCWSLSACTLGLIHDFPPPQQEIVYQAIQSGSGGEDHDATVVGFINKDGSENIVVDIGFRAGQPIYSREMQGLLFHVGKVNPVDIGPYDTNGDVSFITPQGKMQKCKANATWFISPTANANVVFVHNREKLQLLDIKSCSIVKTLLEKNELIGAASLSESEKYLIFYYGYTYPDIKTDVFVMPVDSDVPQKVIETALNGSISPDDKKIAFVRKNGIYISNLDGSDQIKLVSLSYSESTHDEVTLFPFPQWSPDGRYLIYHKCQNTECYHLRDFSMYLFDLETKIETKIADNGLFPTWIR